MNMQQVNGVNQMTKTEEKIIEFKKQIRQIISGDISTAEKVENLWNFFSKHATQVSVLNVIQKMMEDLEMK